MPQFPPGQTLLIDADDTLWENNVYFERAIAAFISYLNHHAYSPAEVRKTLNEVERETILTHGYGLSSFTRSLVTCFERLSPDPVTEEKVQRILSFARSIEEQEIELLPGVAETLVELARRHRLILMTKGNQAEQARQAGSLRALRPLFRSRDRGGKRSTHLSRGYCPPRARAAHELDDRQQPQERYQSRTSRRFACRIPLP